MNLVSERAITRSIALLAASIVHAAKAGKSGSESFMIVATANDFLTFLEGRR